MCDSHEALRARLAAATVGRLRAIALARQATQTLRDLDHRCVMLADRIDRDLDRLGTKT